MSDKPNKPPTIAPVIAERVGVLDFNFVQAFSDPAKVSKYAQAFETLENVMEAALVAMVTESGQPNLGEKLIGAKNLIRHLQLFKIQEAYNLSLK